MEFTGYFALYGLICLGLSLIFFVDDRKNQGSIFRFIFSFILGIVLITMTYSSIHFVSEYQQYWMLSRRIITIFLKFIEYGFIVILYYGILKTIYNDWYDTAL